MSRDPGYYTSMFEYGMEVLDEAAEDVAALEEQPVYVTLPPKPGRKAVTLEVRGYFEENPAVNTIGSTGIGNSLNGVLHVRRNQTPEDLRRSAEDESIAAGLRFSLRGRDLRCIKAVYQRGMYLFTLQDLRETTHE